MTVSALPTPPPTPPPASTLTRDPTSTRKNARESGTRPHRSPQRVVALGGGHGLAASLAALRRLHTDLTAVVTVADNGGSSGRLREEFACLPPGDLRMALAALCDETDWGGTWARVLQHRFHSGGELDAHAVGNLLIVALWEQLGDHVGGLDLVGSLLGARGRVLPMALAPLELVAQVRGVRGTGPQTLSTVRGQVEVATSTGEVLGVRLEPGDPPACPEALHAIGAADWVVLGPGSWFSSVIPHLLVPAQREALTATAGKVVVVLNLAPQHGETEGFTATEHLQALAAHAPDLRVHTVLVHDQVAGELPRLRDAAASLGARLHVADVAEGDGTPRHDPKKLAAAYAEVLGSS